MQLTPALKPAMPDHRCQLGGCSKNRRIRYGLAHGACRRPFHRHTRTEGEPGFAQVAERVRLYRLLPSAEIAPDKALLAVQMWGEGDGRRLGDGALHADNYAAGQVCARLHQLGIAREVAIALTRAQFDTEMH